MSHDDLFAWIEWCLALSIPMPDEYFSVLTDLREKLRIARLYDLPFSAEENELALHTCISVLIQNAPGFDDRHANLARGSIS